jgi:hypothetical protein
MCSSQTDDSELIEGRVEVGVDEPLTCCACRLGTPAISSVFIGGAGEETGEERSLRSLRPAASNLTPSLRPSTTEAVGAEEGRVGWYGSRLTIRSHFRFSSARSPSTTAS